MANVLTYLRKRKAAGDNFITKVFQCALSGSYLNGGAIGTPGETLNFSTALNPAYADRAKIPSTLNGSTTSLPPNSAFRVLPYSGFTFQVEQNAASPTNANYALRIFASDGTELSSGTYASVAAALTAAGFKGLTIEVDVPQKYD
jgi:hypothetical protein